LIILASSTYAQYPVVKKIGSDSVVLISIKQAEDINKQFDNLSDSINTLKNKKDSIKVNFEQYALDNGKRLQSMYDSYIGEYNSHLKTKAEADSFKIMYLANKRIHEAFEKDVYQERRDRSIFLLAIMVVVVVIAGAH